MKEKLLLGKLFLLPSYRRNYYVMGYDVDTGEMLKANCVESVGLRTLDFFPGLVHRKKARCEDVNVFIVITCFENTRVCKWNIDFNCSPFKQLRRFYLAS